jgi:hypothetical protein
LILRPAFFFIPTAQRGCQTDDGLGEKSPHPPQLGRSKPPASAGFSISPRYAGGNPMPESPMIEAAMMTATIRLGSH